jgi:SRSO17 transposase
VSDPTGVAYFACGGPPGTTIRDLVRVAGTRWAVGDLFELAKGDCGLDEYEVWSCVGWYRHVTLSLFALAVLAVIRARAGRQRGPRLIPLTVPEVRKLLLKLVWDRLAPAELTLAWSA